MLRGGGRRHLGRVDEAIVLARADRRIFARLVEGIGADDPVMAMRACDAAEKVSRERPEWLAPFADLILGEYSAIPDQNIRWHLALMIGRLPLSGPRRDQAMSLLLGWMDQGRSPIVTVNSMETLAVFAERDHRLKDLVMDIIAARMADGPASVAARGRLLEKRLLKL